MTTGSGLAKAMADAALASSAMVAILAPSKPVAGHERDPWSPGVHASKLDFYCDIARFYARLVEAMANGFAAGVVAHLQANAVVTIDTSTSVGRLPGSFSANAPIQPPAAPVALSIT